MSIEDKLGGSKCIRSFEVCEPEAWKSSSTLCLDLESSLLETLQDNE